MSTAAKGPLAALLAAAFIVALGYGIYLPVLPTMVEQLAGSADPILKARHIGVLTAAFVAASVPLAFLWGRASDSIGRRPILVVGLIGFAVTLAASAFAWSLPALYVVRLLNGGFAAAIAPTALAFIADTEFDNRRARAFGWISMASIAGFLVGPMLGGFAAELAPTSDALTLQTIPFLLALAAAAGAWIALPGGRPPMCLAASEQPGSSGFISGEIRLLVLAAAAAAGLGAFEVGFTLRNEELAMSRGALGLMFATCSVVMFAVQGLIFSPIITPTAARRLVAPAFVAMGIGLAAIPAIASFGQILLAVSVVAASAGVVGPLLAYWISLVAGRSHGVELGIQSAVVSFGQSAGSAGAGLLFGLRGPYDGAFLAFAAAMAIAAAASLTLPHRLAIAGIAPRTEAGRSVPQ
ncbi:MAG: MFS transporter [Mesorhizobium sp.]|uniref:MFS transporter n=1 Tax=unclassified Mesorhizobium TaxID=325217 RepID=UPI000FCB5D39|nr:MULTISPECIES: MFS transporter [unclassified Mesorhizobium]RUV67027.1 MFS transporter [Mesorhizobium sp. M5C.F.Cr.IN.023.01.1.1]RWF88693.1 MAG: MFS transporter [Mesorhizobium sp.]RWF92917.1 MAG: MFS transporter [Mesorhizobium sp.]RWI41239.1 MAG: MFS transporter [Mesorhizobium sp.]RWI49768.1 MAG: MFS transporter [Mesorhizobium sp.]